MTGATAKMLTETVATTTEPNFEIANFRVSDNDLPEFRDMKFENINELHIDHPGANAKEYRTRRDYIAGLTKQFRIPCEIPDVDYNTREPPLWRSVAEHL